jgi:hypothetical protein
MRGLEPPRSHLHTDLNRIRGAQIPLVASRSSTLRGFAHEFDLLDGKDVVKLLSRRRLVSGRVAYGLARMWANCPGAGRARTLGVDPRRWADEAAAF